MKQRILNALRATLRIVLKALTALLAFAILMGIAFAVGVFASAVFPRHDPWVACSFAFLIGNLFQLYGRDFAAWLKSVGPEQS